MYSTLLFNSFKLINQNKWSDQRYNTSGELKKDDRDDDFEEEEEDDGGGDDEDEKEKDDVAIKGTIRERSM